MIKGSHQVNDVKVIIIQKLHSINYISRDSLDLIIYTYITLYISC